MDNALYVNLTRQIALSRELATVANNIANISTAGYRREGVVFSEFVQTSEGPLGSLSMGSARARYVDLAQGALERTDAPLDLAIEGPGFFQLDTPNGLRLTRGGAMTRNDAGLLSTTAGYLVLDEGGAPLFLPPEGGEVSIATDGTVSIAGEPVGRIGVVTLDDPKALRRGLDGLLIADAPLAPADDARVAQGFLEGSNVDPVAEITRMIEVQRAYELGQTLTQSEDDRIQQTVQTLGRPL